MSRPKHCKILALTELIRAHRRATPEQLAAKLMQELPWHGFHVVSCRKGPKPRPVTRFLDKISYEPNTGCWLWTGAVNHAGYGIFAGKGRYQGQMAHIFSYRTFVGEYSAKKTLDHSCYQPCCVNPEHLEPVTRRENSKRMNETRALDRAMRIALARGYVSLLQIQQQS